MGHVPMLDELAIVAVLAVLVTVVLSKLKLPTVAGLLAAGALAGPFGLHLVKSVQAIEILAEVGVVLLLFSIGLEFSLSRRKNIFRQVALGGALQVGLTIAATAGLAVALGEPVPRGILYGFAFALSSTAIVLRALAERSELDAPHGRFIVGALIFQDLCVVPMVLVVPLLGQGSPAGGAALGMAMALAKAAAVVVSVVGISRYVVPHILGWVDASRSREVFLLAILALCIGTAWLTSLAGLSLALGAFLGGMVVADTEYGHRAMGDILPLRDTFVSIFFVSLGMLFDVRVLVAHPVLVVALLIGFLLAKGLIATLSAMVMGFPARVAWLAGVGLAQFGEFGFVLTRMAQAHGVMSDQAAQPLLAAGIASMFLTPMLVRLAPHVSAGERLLAPLERLLGARGIDDADARDHATLEGHVVIVGFGVAGRFAARTLRTQGMPFVVLDLNAENVKSGRTEGLPVYYGDATSAEALSHAHVSRARLVLLLTNDPQSIPRVLETIGRLAPGVPVLMRTRYLSDRAQLLQRDRVDVVAEEVEGAIELISRMLGSMDVPRAAIEDRLRELRRDTQTTERKLTIPRKQLGDIAALAELKIESVVVEGGCSALGVSPRALQLQTTTGALVVGLTRSQRLLSPPEPSERFEASDLVHLAGTGDALMRARQLFRAAPFATSETKS